MTTCTIVPPLDVAGGAVVGVGGGACVGWLPTGVPSLGAAVGCVPATGVSWVPAPGDPATGVTADTVTATTATVTTVTATAIAADALAATTATLNNLRADAGAFVVDNATKRNGAIGGSAVAVVQLDGPSVEIGSCGTGDLDEFPDEPGGHDVWPAAITEEVRPLVRGPNEITAAEVFTA